MNILHVCSNYVGTKVHSNQVTVLSKVVSHQDVIVPVYSKKHIGVNILEIPNVKIKYFYFRNSFVKYFPFLKVLITLLRTIIIEGKNINRFDVIYAHTLWNNGIVSFFLSLIFKKKLILSIRSTDFYVFMKRLPHYHWLMKLALNRADKIIFISPSYRDKVISKYRHIFSDQEKCIVIPNGIDDFWIGKAKENMPKICDVKNVNILFVGRINNTKRPELAYNTVLSLRNIKGFENATLTFVGCVETDLVNYLGLDDVPDFVRVVGKVNSKEELFKYYRNSFCLLLPSYQETFGLVYLEALASSCPVVLTKGEGISGFFSSNNSIIEIENDNPELIAEKISHINNFSFSKDKITDNFSWNNYLINIKRILGI